MSKISDNKAICWLCGNYLEEETCKICLKILDTKEVKMIKLLGTLDYDDIHDLRFKLELKNMINQLKILAIFMHGFTLMIALLFENYLMFFGTIFLIYPTSIYIWKKLF